MIYSALKSSRRPIFIFGYGVRLAGGEEQALALAVKTGVPVAVTWAMRDLFTESGPLCVGGFGTHGTRGANFAVQNSDLVISVGSRLDTKATGTPPTWFARAARKIMVDIDPKEMGKFGPMGVRLSTMIGMDAKRFLSDALVQDYSGLDFEPWRERCRQWLKDYPTCKPEYEHEECLNPYYLCDRLVEYLRADDTILGDVGCSSVWMMQAFRFKGQRYLQAFNNAPMGYAMSGAIGACYATGKRALAIMGDGSIQMNLAEMATIVKNKLPVKVLLFNSNGYSMIKQTQEQWFGASYLATSPEGGVAVPDFVSIAKAYGFRTDTLERTADLPEKLTTFLADDLPALLNVTISPEARVSPQARFGKPNEDGDPPLDREEFARQMIIEAVG